ncbi:MAG: HD domain-containing phosphohydrolase [Sulfurimonas sp.]
MSIRHVLNNLYRQHVKSPALSLDHTRENILFGMILTTALVGLIAYIPNVIGALDRGHIDTAVVDTLFYFWVIFLLFYKHFTFTQRSLGLIIPIWILSIYLFIRLDITAESVLWLFVAPTLTAILLGLKKGFITLLLTVTALLLTGLLLHSMNLNGDLFGTQPLLVWSVMSGNSLALGTLIMVTASVMSQGLNTVLIQLDKKIKALSLTEDATIDTVAILAKYRDEEIGVHHERTREYVRIIAEYLSQQSPYREILTPAYIKLLYKSAQLHDIGKIGVPDSILRKSGKLTPEEKKIMEAHTIYGRDALLRSKQNLGDHNFLQLAAEIAYTHQERWDGSGYPRGLEREEIPLSGRIMAVADVYDALTSRRVYKAPVSHEDAITYLKENSGILFDPEILLHLPEFESKFLEICQIDKS